MGWSMSITADKPIEAADVTAALAAVEGEPIAQHQWGWSATCDVSNPDGNDLLVSGAWYSFDEARHFGSALAGELRARGYKVKTTKPE